MKQLLNKLCVGLVLLICVPVYGQGSHEADSLHSVFAGLEENSPEHMLQLAGQCLHSNGGSPHWKVEAEACIAMGKYEWYAVNFPASLQWYSRALKAATDNHDRQLAIAAHRGIGSVYLWEQNFAAAMEQFMAGAKLASLANDDRLLSDVYIDIGLYYRWDGNAQVDRKQALSYYNKAAGIKQRLKDTVGLARVYNCIGSVYLDELRLSQALDTTLLALQMVNATSNKYRKAKICKTLAYIYYEMRDDSKAEQYGLASLTLYDETKIFEGLIDANEILSLVYERKGRHKEALDRYKAFAAANDRMNSKTNNRLLTEMQLKAEQDRKDLIASNKLRHERQTTKAAIIIAALLLVLAGVAIMAYRRKKSDNVLITRLVNEQEKTIELRTAQLAETNEKLTYNNKKLLELIQYNAHNLREPLTRIMGAIYIKPDMDQAEFEAEVWPLMHKAVTDLDTSIRNVVKIADETVTGT